MVDLRKFLQELGFTAKEVKIYLCGLKLGSQTASVIAKKVLLPRSTVAFLFEELVKKGFASKEIKGKVIYYEVISPEYLEGLVMDKIAKGKKLMNDFKEALPLLASFKNKFSINSSVRYFEGYEGLCRMLDDFCAEDQTVLYISGHNMMHPKVREYTYNVYLPVSNKHKNKNKIILNDGEKAREYAKVAANAYDEFIFVDSKWSFTLTTAIYGNKIAFWSYDPKDMTGVIIENQLIADNMRTFFEILKKFFQIA